MRPSIILIAILLILPVAYAVQADAPQQVTSTYYLLEFESVPTLDLYGWAYYWDVRLYALPSVRCGDEDDQLYGLALLADFDGSEVLYGITNSEVTTTPSAGNKYLANVLNYDDEFLDLIDMYYSSYAELDRQAYNPGNSYYGVYARQRANMSNAKAIAFCYGDSPTEMALQELDPTATPTAIPTPPTVSLGEYYLAPVAASVVCDESNEVYPGAGYCLFNAQAACGQDTITGVVANSSGGIGYEYDYRFDQPMEPLWYISSDPDPDYYHNGMSPGTEQRFYEYFTGQTIHISTQGITGTFSVQTGDILHAGYAECKGERRNKCNEVGEIRRFTVDNLVGGELSSQSIVEDQTYYIFDATVTTNTTSPILAGFNRGDVTVALDDPYGLLSEPGEWGIGALTATVNGVTVTIEPGVASPLGMAGGGSTLTVHVYGKIPGRTAGPSEEMPSVGFVSVTAPLISAQENLICDGGMEEWPTSNFWQLTDQNGFLFGRPNRQMDNLASVTANGLPACGYGHQATGWFYDEDQNLPYMHDPGGTIDQEFSWPGGQLDYKIRLRGYSAHVWIQDTAGSNVVSLFGDGTYGGGLLTNSWQLFTGTVDLDPGTYRLMLDSGPQQWWALFQYVAYDDVSLGGNINQECDEPILEKTEFPTPTPTSTNVTPSPSPTSIPTRTMTTTRTVTRTATITTTAWPTRTRTVTSTLQNPPTGTVVPPTSTPYGEPQPATGTPGPTMTGTITPQTEGTQTGWTGGDLPPGPGDPGNDPGSGDCNRPANAWSIAGWIDYEFCRLFYAVSWQPGHSATLAALPNRYSNYEPMRSVNDIKAQTDLIVTEAAAVNWNGGMGSLPQTTAESYRPGSGSPYNGGRIELDTGSTGVYTQWCQLQLQQAIGSGLMRGVCFTLNVLRAKQLLWLYQAVINLGSVAIAVQSIVNIIRLRLRYA